MFLLLTVSRSWACGGFFCDSVEPVAQSAERILFREDEGGEWTTFVEVQFRGPPIAFGWVVPIPRVLDPETEIGVAPAGLFDALEGVTAPRFVDEATGAPAGYADLESADCSSGCGTGEGYGTFEPDTSGVEVVGAAVVGPYDLEVITAGDGTNLAAWLQGNGYQIPYSAWSAFEAYIDDGYAFLGVKLAPDVPAGPIDTLVLRCGAFEPRIPLLLTAVAAVDDMEIVAYVLSDDRYVPDADWVEVPVDPASLSLAADGTSDYPYVLRTQVDAVGGHGFRTEFAGPASEFVSGLDAATQEALGHGAYLTRLRTFVSAPQMTTDPGFVADPEAPDVDNVIVVPTRTATAGLGVLGVLLLSGTTIRRRRR